MIRRYYILPLRPGVPAASIDEFIRVLGAADRFIPGLHDSSAGLDATANTVLWENTFVDEASYSGPYMVHPYHIGAIDDFVMADSPTCLTQDIFTVRHQTADATQQVRGGIRRVLLLNLESDADASAVRALATDPAGMAASAFGADDVGWVSAKGRAWSHVWEQAFTDAAQLERYLHTRDGIACSSVEGLTRLGVGVGALRILTCPFELTPPQDQTPPPPAGPDGPVVHTITARTAPEDADTYVDQLTGRYDPFMAAGGARFLHRWRTVDRGYAEVEIHSAWRLETLASYSDIRAATYADPGWNDFVRDAMPLVRGGSRRFQHAL